MDTDQNAMPLPDRRKVILMGATGAMALAGMGFQAGRRAWAQKASSLVLTPEETEGPYWVDEKLKRSDVRIDPYDKTMQKGLPLTLNVKVSQRKNGVISPLSGAYVDIWHCSAQGQYSDMQQENTQGRKFLRGYQVTDGKGLVQFTTVYPGWYRGRTVHIHARVRTVANGKTTHDFATQFFFDDNVTNHVYKQAPYNTRPNRDLLNNMDGIYNSPAAQSGTRTVATQAKGELLMLKLVEDSRHAVGTFDMLLDLATLPAHTRGGGPGGPGGPGFGPPGGGRPPFGGPPPDGFPPDGPPPPPPDGFQPFGR